MRPASIDVETANGTVPAQGVATVDVPALGHSVDALVLQSSPCLLSAGALVRSGYSLSWDNRGCRLTTPCGEVKTLRVDDGIPILDHCDAYGEREAAGTAAVAARPVVDGVAENHRQQGHYPWSDECAVCAEASLRSRQHRRREPDSSTLSVDLASLGTGGPYVLVGCVQVPGQAYVEQIRSKSAQDLRGPLLRMILSAKERGDVRHVRADQELGLMALEEALLSAGCKLSLTQGRDPQSNGAAENLVGRLCGMARAVLGHYKDVVKEALWPSAMVWAAQRLCDHALPPFGRRVLARHPPKRRLGKLSGRTLPTIFLHKSSRVPGAV